MLTKKDVDRLQYDPDGPERQITYDGPTGLPGFGCRVHPTGRKVFVYRYRTTKGRDRFFTVGVYGPFTVQAARDLAQDEARRVAKGGDPVAERKKERQGDTLKDFSATYLKRHAKPHKKSWKEDDWRLNKYILPALGAHKLSEITRSDVAHFHQEIGDRSHAEANRCLALLSVMYNLAADWGNLPQSHPNPCLRIKKYRIQSRDRWVKPVELPTLMAAVEQEPNVHVRAAIKLLLLTGLRKGELLGLKWADVDTERRELHLSDTKAARSHTVPLSAPAVEILRTLPRMLGNDYLIPSPVEPGKPLNNLNKPWNRIRERAGLGKLRIHDLRRTAGSWLAEDGASLPLIGRVLNHSNACTTQIYARMGDDPARAALETYGARLGTLMLGGGAS